MSDTISLYDGLEALYYFHPDYFDGSQLSDRSGRGRHATASGGPTISDDGYRGFGAASFDGTDDSFDSGFQPNFSQFTVCAIYKPTDVSAGDQHIIDALNASTGFRLRVSSGDLEFQFRDGSGVLNKIVELNTEENAFAVTTAQYDGGGIRLSVNGKLVDSQINTFTTSQENLVLGSSGSGNFFNGGVSLGGVWSRVLTDAEIAELNRLTAPLRGVSP